jgi:hypothetical protein
MDREHIQALRNAGAEVAAQRENRADYGSRTPEDVHALREQAASTASMCADCFQPLAPTASVTMARRPVRLKALSRHEPRERWLTVPICVACWLLTVRRFVGDIERFRCEGCGRPMRARLPYRRLHHTERCCCEDCQRLTTNTRARERRRRVQHSEIACEVCGKDFVPTRSDARTCSNTCRQKRHRQAHSR